VAGNLQADLDEILTEPSWIIATPPSVKPASSDDERERRSLFQGGGTLLQIRLI
jgi:hypothetical protein